MYINATGYYIPTERVSNDHFFEINGLTSDWILQRTGINTRSKAGEGETVTTALPAGVAVSTTASSSWAFV